MMIRVNRSEYLDFNEDVEIQKQAKLFEEISTSNGDFSYSFDVPFTAHNAKKLGLPFPDIDNKIIYKKVDAEILNNEGLTISLGYVRVEKVSNRLITISFLSGNNNWFGLLSQPLSDIDFSDLDVDISLAEIIASANNTSGIVFSLTDNGTLISRSSKKLMVEDFAAGIYVHTVIERIFLSHSIKIEGDLISDPTYKYLFTKKSQKSQDKIDGNSVFAGSVTSTDRLVNNGLYKVYFTDVTTYPWYNGAEGSYDPITSVFTAPYQMRINVSITLIPDIVDADYNNRIRIYINGVYPGFVDIGLDAGNGGYYNSSTHGDIDSFSLIRTYTLEAGDTFEVYTTYQSFTGGRNDVLSGTLKIIPEFIYMAFGSSVIPEWSQQKYVSNVFKLFNVLPTYDPYGKTLTLDLFDRIKYKGEIDISEHIESIDYDFTDFISNYGKNNLFSYNQVDFQLLKDYNIQNYFKYGQGIIESGNDFLDNNVDVVKSDFSNPVGYLNRLFDMSLELIDLLTFETSTGVTPTSVTDSSGIARFNIPENIFFVGDLIRIEDSRNPIYNGEWIVETKGSGYIEFYGLNYDSDEVYASLTKLSHKYNDSDDVYIFINVPDYSISNFSSDSTLRVVNTDLSSIALSYFSLLDTGRQINIDYIQSLSFGGINNILFYQRTLLEAYWKLFEGILQDPTKVIPVCLLPYSVYLKIDFKKIIRIKSNDTSNIYYPNKLLGYKNSYQQCILELIKIP